MYRVIIADDEESIRNRIKSMLDKLKDDFEVVGCFENGFDALEGGIPLEPDLIITDIKMPYISGIELIRRAQMELPLVRSIIISGYDSFDYAKEAISLGVIGYLTKPIIFDEFKAALSKVKESLDNQSKTDNNLKVMEEKAKDYIDYIRSDDLNKLITIKDIPEYFKTKLDEDGINLDYDFQMIAIFDSDSDYLSYDQTDLMYGSLISFLEDEFEDTTPYYAFHVENRLVVLFLNDVNFDIEKVSLVLNKILIKIKKMYDISISCGLSDIANKPVNYRKLYRHAKRTLEYRTVYGSNLILSFSELEKTDDNFRTGKIDDNEYKNLSYLVAYGKEEVVINKLNSFIEQICNPLYKDNYYYILSNILDSILKSCISLKDFYQNFESQVEISNNLYSIKNKDTLIEYFTNIAKVVMKINESKKLSGLETSFDRINKFLEAHYTECDLSIEDVANELAYSVSYISAILKKNNTSFTKITTELRMKKAVELLSNKENRIISIAKEVGYSDPYYFSHCFKKYKGMSPDEYRKKEISE